MDIIGEFLDGDGSCADNTGKRILTACNRVEKNRFIHERRCTGMEKAFVARGVRDGKKRTTRKV